MSFVLLLLLFNWLNNGQFVLALLTPSRPSHSLNNNGMVPPQYETTKQNHPPTTTRTTMSNVGHLSSSLPELLHQLIPYTTMPLEDSLTLPPQAYTDPALFAMEMATIFRPGWICVAHMAQLKHKGDYLTLDLLGERMVIVNNSNDDSSTTGTTSTSVAVLSRVCTHRWATVCETTGSCSQNNNRFTCPMHKWSFDLNGTLLGTPYMDNNNSNNDDGAKFSKYNYNLHQYRSEVIGGFIYVNIDGKAEPLAPQIQGLTDWLQNWETNRSELLFTDGISYECDFNWKIMVETFMEAYHHMGAHPTTFEPNFPANLSYADLDDHPGYQVGHAAPRPGKEESAFQNGLPFFPKLDRTNKRETQAFAFMNVFPCHMMLALPDSIVWHRVQPISPRKTLFQAFCLVPPETLQISDLDNVRNTYLSFMDKFNREDIVQNMDMQKGVESGSARIGRLHSRLEACVWQLNTYVATKLTAAATMAGTTTTTTTAPIRPIENTL